MSGRIRTLKPEILDDEPTAALPDDAWRMLVSMNLLADDYGCLRLGERFLAANVWQDTTRDAGSPLAKLIKERFVVPYAKGDQAYGWIRGFSEHQRVDNAGFRRVPSPDQDDGSLPTWFREVRDRFAETLGESPWLAEYFAKGHKASPTRGGLPPRARAQTRSPAARPRSRSDHDQDQDPERETPRAHEEQGPDQEPERDKDPEAGVSGLFPVPSERGPELAPPAPPRAREPSTDARQERLGVSHVPIPIPPDLQLDDQARGIVVTVGAFALADAPTEWLKFVGHHKANGTLARDWYALWQKWCCMAKGMRARASPSGRAAAPEPRKPAYHRPPPPMAKTGDS